MYKLKSLGIQLLYTKNFGSDKCTNCSQSTFIKIDVSFPGSSQHPKGIIWHITASYQSFTVDI